MTFRYVKTQTISAKLRSFNDVGERGVKSRFYYCLINIIHKTKRIIKIELHRLKIHILFHLSLFNLIAQLPTHILHLLTIRSLLRSQRYSISSLISCPWTDYSAPLMRRRGFSCRWQQGIIGVVDVPG